MHTIFYVFCKWPRFVFVCFFFVSFNKKDSVGRRYKAVHVHVYIYLSERVDWKQENVKKNNQNTAIVVLLYVHTCTYISFPFDVLLNDIIPLAFSLYLSSRATYSLLGLYHCFYYCCLLLLLFFYDVLSLKQCTRSRWNYIFVVEWEISATLDFRLPEKGGKRGLRFFFCSF